MQIKQIIVGSEQATNCYLVWENPKEALLIDPGFDGEYILKEISKHGLSVKQIVLSHGHFDHLGAVDKIRKETAASLLIHEADQAALIDSESNLSYLLGEDLNFLPADTLLKDGEIIQISEQVEFKVIHTPGHSPGSISLYNEEEGILFSGDTIFAMGIGRTDLPHCSYEDLLVSLDKLLGLPLKTRVFPGHGPATSIEEFQQYYQSIQ